MTTDDGTDRMMARRMYRTAMAYEAGAQRLSTAARLDVAEGASLLGLLSFEILLKAVWRVSRGEVPRFGHRYAEGWAGLSETVRAEVLSEAQLRRPGRADLDALSEILPRWENAFTKGRYDYEAAEGLKDAEMRRRGEEWTAAGSPPEQADFYFHPRELHAMSYGLRRWLEGQLDVSSDVPI